MYRAVVDQATDIRRDEARDSFSCQTCNDPDPAVLFDRPEGGYECRRCHEAREADA